MNDAKNTERQALLYPYYVNPGSFVYFVQDALLGLLLITQDSRLERHL
jgi:hypothetical protein